MQKIPAILIALALSVGTPAYAQSASANAPSPLPTTIQELDKCRAITDDSRRLACFDAAAAGLSGAIESKQVVVVEQQEIKKTKRSLFGFRLPDLSIFGDKDDPADQQLLTSVTKAALGPNGRWNITTAEGAIWQTTEPVPFAPKPDDALEIKSGALGSYFVKVRGKRAVRAIRVQ